MKKIEADSIFYFAREKKILNGIYFSAQTGNLTGIIGRNGSGKTTLLRVLFGELLPSEGMVRIDGRFTRRAFKGGEQIAYLPAIPFIPAYLKTDTILDTIIPLNDFPEIARETWNLRGRKIGELSGGERRILEILFILSRPVPFILLDEPLHALSPKLRTAFMELFASMKHDRAIIIADHVHRDLAEFCDVIWMMDGGRLSKGLWGADGYEISV